MKAIKIILVFLFIGVAAIAQETKPPYYDEIQAFKKQDSISFPPKDAILFVGSSSFTKWTDVQDYFPDHTIINRGFGGSTLQDVIRYANDIIYPYNPKQIAIYCGENDLAYSDTVTSVHVLNRFRELFRIIRNKYPHVPVAYISIKPSPSRRHLMLKMTEANLFIETFLKKQKLTAFIDVYHSMVDASGTPLGEIFGSDSLHMNSKGYHIWQKLIEPHLLNSPSAKNNSSNTIQLTSPDGKIVFSFSLQKSKPIYSAAYNKQVLPTYSLAYNKQTLIQNSSIDLIYGDGVPFQKCSMKKAPQFSSGIEKYKLVVGKASSVSHPYNKATFFLKENSYDVNFEVKVFNDGVAFRYLFPEQVDKALFSLLDEQTQFNVVGNPVIKALQLPNYTSSHEGIYTTAPVSEIKNDTLMDMPALLQFPNNTVMAITEAALLNYAGMYLIKRNGILTSQLSPLPNKKGIIKRTMLPIESPWRVMMIGNSIGALIESNILTSLCPPLALKETAWIKTGTTTFPWWNGTIIPESVKGGNNFETNKYYIDFCAANNIKYHTVVEFGGHEWYTNEGEGYQPGKSFDVTKPVDGLDMKQVCDYAHSKGVGVRVWVHWKALYPKLDSAFAIFERWGLSGMMVDFMDRDDQEMVNIQTEILEKAAKHHLHIQFHGAYKPTGLHRTYPNEFTREGTLNYETYKWDTTLTPDDDLNIAVTRMLAGSTDYHLGGFRAFGMPHQNGNAAFKVEYLKPLVMGTRCHMLGMYVVLENYQGMVCDYPDAYINQPGFEVLQHIPTTWDETHVAEAKIDEYISIARRKGNDWWIGTISNHDKHTLNINLNFLPVGKYTATIYSDADDVSINPNHLKKEIKQVDNKTKLKINISQGGGNVMVLHKN